MAEVHNAKHEGQQRDAIAERTSQSLRGAATKLARHRGTRRAVALAAVALAAVPFQAFALLARRATVPLNMHHSLYGWAFVLHKAQPRDFVRGLVFRFASNTLLLAARELVAHLIPRLCRSSSRRKIVRASAAGLSALVATAASLPLQAVHAAAVRDLIGVSWGMLRVRRVWTMLRTASEAHFAHRRSEYRADPNAIGAFPADIQGGRQLRFFVREWAAVAGEYAVPSGVLLVSSIVTAPRRQSHPTIQQTTGITRAQLAVCAVRAAAVIVASFGCLVALEGADHAAETAATMRSDYRRRMIPLPPVAIVASSLAEASMWIAAAVLDVVLPWP